MLQLPPLSYEEAIQPEPDLTADEFMFRGGYPHLYDASTPNDIYFHDNGLLNYLLGIHSAEELLNDPKRGDVFENLIISQTVKRYLNKKQRRRAVLLPRYQPGRNRPRRRYAAP